MNKSSLKSSYPWFLVGLLWIVAFLNYFDRILITSMRDPIVSAFTLTDAQIGLLTSVFLWSYGILSPFGGFLSDKYSRKLVIIFSAFVWSGVTLWTGLASSFHEMLIARTFMGISKSLLYTCGFGFNYWLSPRPYKIPGYGITYQRFICRFGIWRNRRILCRMVGMAVWFSVFRPVWHPVFSCINIFS